MGGCPGLRVGGVKLTLAILPFAALVLAGCAAEPSAGMVTPTPVATTAAALASETTQHTEDCTASAPALPDSPIPTNTSMSLYVDNTEDNFDPCAKLSWVELGGSLGTPGNGPAHTGASMVEALVLFHDGEMIAAPAPVVSESIESVQRISDRALSVELGHRTGSTAAGITETESVVFEWDGSALRVTGYTPPANASAVSSLDLSQG